MSQLVQIKDFQFIALKDSVNITDEDRKSFLSKTTHDFQSQDVDVPTSLKLVAEYNKCPFSESEFVNDINEGPKSITQDDDFVYITSSYSVKSDRIPLLLKKAGMQIKRETRIAYITSSDDPEHPYLLINKDGTPFESEQSSGGRLYKLNIQLYNDVLALRKDEYERYLNAKKLIRTGRYKEAPKEDIYLWALVGSFVNVHEELDVVFHEMRHAQNSIAFFDALFNDSNFKLSVDEIWKQGRDDELSAKLAEAIEAINTYNRSQNKNDLSVFETSYLFQQLLHDKTVAERERLLSDIPVVINEVCLYWYKTYYMGYKPQFARNAQTLLWQLPLKQIVKESDTTSYQYLRKLMFSYNVLDPKSGKYVNMDLSKYVIDLDVDRDTLDMTQQLYVQEVLKRQRSIQMQEPRIQYDIVDEARKEYEKCVLNTEYRKTLAELQSLGLDYASALGFIPGVTDITYTQENTESVEQPDTVIQKETESVKQPDVVIQEEIVENTDDKGAPEIQPDVVQQQEKSTVTPAKPKNGFAKAINKLVNKVLRRHKYIEKKNDGIGYV